MESTTPGSFPVNHDHARVGRSKPAARRLCLRHSGPAPPHSLRTSEPTRENCINGLGASWCNFVTLDHNLFLVACGASEGGCAQQKVVFQMEKRGWRRLYLSDRDPPRKPEARACRCRPQPRAQRSTRTPAGRQFPNEPKLRPRRGLPCSESGLIVCVMSAPWDPLLTCNTGGKRLALNWSGPKTKGGSRRAGKTRPRQNLASV